MEIAAQDAAIDKAKAMVVGARHPTKEECKMKNNLCTVRIQVDHQRSALMAELKAPCASGTTLSRREWLSPSGAFEN